MHFLPEFQQTLQQHGVEGALELCRSENGYIPRRLFTAGLENAAQGLAAMRRAMASVIELELIPDLNYLLPSILAIAKIATMVGLLGTVISMIGTFQALGDAAKSAAEGAGAPADRHRPAARLAWRSFATALGLVTAIPLVFAHVLFKAYVHKFEIEMKNSAQKLLVLVQAMKNPQPATHTRSRIPAG